MPARGEGGRGEPCAEAKDVEPDVMELLERAFDPLFSATTLSDFSKTFQSLIVLSVDCPKEHDYQPLYHVVPSPMPT